MRAHIIDELRPDDPSIDPVWEAETVQAILENRKDDVPFTTRRRRQERRGRLALVAAAIAVLIAGAAVARDRLPSSDVRPAGPVPEKIVQKIDPSTATALKLGDTLDVAADLPPTLNGDRVSFFAFTDDGMLLGTVVPEQTEQAAPAVPQSHPVMYDLVEKTFTLLDHEDRPEPMQVVDVSGNENTVVWAELIGTSIDHSSFTFYAYDRETREVTTIGEFTDPDGQIVYGNDLAIAGDTAFFSTPAYPKKRGQEAVYSVPVDGSRPPSVLAAGGEMVRVSGETLTYQVRNPHDDDGYPTFYTHNLRTGETTPVPVSAHVDDPTFCGAEFTPEWETWCVGRTDDDEDPQPALLTIKEASGRTTEFAPFPTDSYNAPIPHDIITLGSWTAITLTTDDGQDRKFLVDLDTKDVKVFPENTSFGSLSPDRSMVLISSYAGKGAGPQRIVRIPTPD